MGIDDIYRQTRAAENAVDRWEANESTRFVKLDNGNFNVGYTDAVSGEITVEMVGDNYLGTRIDSSVLLPELTRCLT